MKSLQLWPQTGVSGEYKFVETRHKPNKNTLLNIEVSYGSDSYHYTTVSWVEHLQFGLSKFDFQMETPILQHQNLKKNKYLPILGNLRFDYHSWVQYFIQ